MSVQPENLSESNEFLNLVLENINAAVLIVDRDLHIHYHNRTFSDLFDRAADIPGDRSFGRIAGCVNAIRENRSCGHTSHCSHCLLRNSLLETLTANQPAEGRRLERLFFIDGKPVRKILEFNNRVVSFHGRKLVLVIIFDITEIEKQRRRLAEQREVVERELETAAEIQKSLLPDTGPVFESVFTAWRFEPSSHIGGDLFQVEKVADDRLCIYILDVCGHGVSAALVAVAISQFLTSLHNRMRLTGKAFSPKAVMKRLSEAFPLDRFDCFFSIAYVVLNPETGKLVYANAGHMPPYLVRAGGEIRRLSGHGTVIGSGFDTAFEQEEDRMHAGDKLLLYTDGLLENFGPDGERDGRDLFVGGVKAYHRLPADEMVDGIFRRAGEWRRGTPPSDDMSLIAVEYRPTAGGVTPQGSGDRPAGT